jgi:PAS domain S-box-containing protein
MNIVPERAAVVADKEGDELTVLMDGFRIVLTKNEAHALASALSRGLDQLNRHHSEHQLATGAGKPFAGPDKAPPLAALSAHEVAQGGRASPVAWRETVSGGGASSDEQWSRGGSLALLLAATHAGVIVIDPRQPDDPIVFANAAAAAMTGYGVAELVGQNLRILYGPATDPQVVERIRQARENGRAVAAALLNYRKDGATLWTKLDLSPIRGADDRLIAFVGVLLDVSEQKRIEEEAHRLRVAADRANQAKSEFIAGISHDLRTALTGLIGFTNLLLNEGLSGEQRRYATLAREAGNSLLAVINNVLDLSKIEAGKLELVEVDFGVIELAVSCHAAVWQAAREKGLDLNFVLKPDVPNMIRGDPDKIRRVLLNLLSNAIKFTEKGNVILSLSKVEDRSGSPMLKFSVTDTGIGIAKEKQELLFRRFSQIEGGRREQGGSSGLGLAISKSLVEQMAGIIGVTSTPDVGSQFSFTLPLKPSEGFAATQAGVEPERRRKARILVAEDTPINQELMVTLLRRAGHEVDLVTTGEAAVAAVQRKQFDLILMDVQLPRMDGFAATRSIRALASSMRTVPVIALTARALTKDVEDCLAAGMNDHLSKPIDAAKLLAAVERWTRLPRPADLAEYDEEPGRAPIHDETMLRDLESHLGREKVATMIALARDDIPARLERMQRGLADDEFGRQQAHELVSIAGNLGFTELVARSRQFIEVSTSGDGERIRAAYKELRSAGDRAVGVMGRMLRGTGRP